jgi:hypothetical protein
MAKCGHYLDVDHEGIGGGTNDIVFLGTNLSHIKADRRFIFLFGDGMANSRFQITA